MKYDRPVWQIMHQCADAMAATEREQPVRYEDVRDWFSAHYPNVHEATIRAHLIGLTEGGRAKHVQFAQRSPVFRRVARGEYAAIPRAERGENPDAPTPSASRVKLFGSARPSAADRSDDTAGTGETARGAEVSKHQGKARKSSGDTAPVSAAATAFADPVDHVVQADLADDSDCGDEPEWSAEPVDTAPEEKAAPAEPAPAPAPAYEPRPRAERPIPLVPLAPLDMGHARELHDFDIVLLGSLGDRVQVPAPAKDIFRAPAFQLSRTDEEAVGSRWFVLSAEHGLVAPDEWISPDARTLAELDPEYRVVWAAWVAARLQSLVGPLDDLTIRVDAPDAFVGPLFAELQQAGAIVSTNTAGWDREEPQLAQVVPLLDVRSVSDFLSDPHHTISPADLDIVPSSAGLYGWSVDPIGARELNRCLRLPIRAGLLFVGQVGVPTARLASDPVLTLREHLDGVQLNGRARASTFRMTLATVLRQHLQLSSLDDPRLTEWMREHLLVTVWSVDDVSTLADLERRVVADLRAPLNLEQAPSAAYRERLSEMRGALV